MDSYFDFRIIICTDGTEIIDRRLKTPYNALTPLEVMEYTEVDIQLDIMDRMKRKAQEEAERRRRIARNPLWKLACFCGLV